MTLLLLDFVISFGSQFVSLIGLRLSSCSVLFSFFSKSIMVESSCSLLGSLLSMSCLQLLMINCPAWFHSFSYREYGIPSGSGAESCIYLHVLSTSSNVKSASVAFFEASLIFGMCVKKSQLIFSSCISYGKRF
jgi:hypothetical protein